MIRPAPTARRARVNQFAGGAFFALTSGSLNSSVGSGGAEVRDYSSYRSRASMSYITGAHHMKLGYDGAYFKQLQTNEVNDPQLTYNYVWPSATADCSIVMACGNTSLQFPERPEQLRQAAGAEHGGFQHRRGHARRPRDVQRVLRAGPVDA